MIRLSDADYRGVLRFLYEAGEVEEADAFPRPLRSSLAALLRVDDIWCWAFPDGRKEFRWGFGAAAVDDAFPPDVARQFDGRHAHEDPMSPFTRFLNVPVRRSDVISRRAWQRTGIWATIDRPLGSKDWTRLMLGSEHALLARLEFDSCVREIDDRVVGVLQLLAPHLRQLLRRAEVRACFRDDAGLLTPREREILALVASGRTNGELARILWISPHTVRKHLENAFDKLGVHTRTAAVARAFGGAGHPHDAGD